MAKDRTEYYKQWYQAHKSQRKANYVSRKTYVKWSDVKRALASCHKQIGDANYEIVMDKLYELDSHVIEGR